MEIKMFLQKSYFKSSYLLLLLLPLVFVSYSKLTLQSINFENLQSMLIVGWIAAILTGLIPFFSVQQSFSHLTSTQTFRNHLDILDVFRVVAICWVIANHLGSEGRIDILERQPSGTIFKMAVHNNSIFGALLGNSALGVEIFLVLSGLLSAKSWKSCKPDSTFGPRYMVFVIRRWLRLMPTIFVFISLVSSSFTKRFLPRFYTTMVGSCGTSGILSHLTFTSNFASTPTCLGYLWYLGLDMQLQLAAPFVLTLLSQRPRSGFLLCIFSISFSSFLRALYCQFYDVCNKSDVDIPFISYPDDDPVIIKQIYVGLWEIYSRPSMKFGSFLIGLMAGQFLNDLRIHLHFSSAQLRTIFVIAFALAVAVVYGILPEYWYPDQGTTIYNTLYTALFCTVFGGAIATMILALYLDDHRSKIGSIWTILAKLTFNVYLVHMPVVYMFNHFSLFQRASGVLGLLSTLPLAIALSFIIAFIFYSFVEAPLSVLSAKILQNFVH